MYCFFYLLCTKQVKNTIKMTNLKIPNESQTPYEWALENNLPEAKDGMLWKECCQAIGVTPQGTESPKICIGRNIRAALRDTMPSRQVAAKIGGNEPKVTTATAASQELAQMMAAAIQPLLNLQQQQPIDQAAIIELIKQYAPTKHIEINLNGAINTVEGITHYQFEQLLKIVSAGVNIMLVGAAGSGKTTLVEQCAKALGREFYCMSVGNQTTKSDLMGYMDAQGRYVKTIFRDAYEFGGVFCLDEVDAGNANTITCLNSALSNGVCAFGDGMVKKHADFQCVATANTFGSGASRSYVGRNQMDAASLDRFVTVEIKYDENMERIIAGHDSWVATVQKVRKAMEGERIVISPRASIMGAKLLKAGLTHKEVFDMTILKGCSEDIKTKINAAL